MLRGRPLLPRRFESTRAHRLNFWFLDRGAGEVHVGAEGRCGLAALSVEDMATVSRQIGVPAHQLEECGGSESNFPMPLSPSPMVTVWPSFRADGEGGYYAGLNG